MPADCDLNNLEVLVDGEPGVPVYIGPPDSEGLQQVNAWLPAGVRTGLVPVELLATASGFVRLRSRALFPPGPLVPRIVSITDGINLVLQNATNTRAAQGSTGRGQRRRIQSPPTWMIRPVERLDILRTDPRTPRHELNLELPADLPQGPHIAPDPRGPA